MSGRVHECDYVENFVLHVIGVKLSVTSVSQTLSPKNDEAALLHVQEQHSIDGSHFFALPEDPGMQTLCVCVRVCVCVCVCVCARARARALMIDTRVVGVHEDGASPDEAAAGAPAGWKFSFKGRRQD
jgi:hypothetical protein